MKVNGHQPLNPSDVTAGKAREKAEASRVLRDGQAREPEAVANRQSFTATRVRDALRAEPDVRPDRVEEVKEKIRSGKFQVDTEKLAENMLLASLTEDLEQT